MTRVRVCRGIAALASLAALSLGPQAALCETSSSTSPRKISSRFLNSLEQQATVDATEPSSHVEELHPPIEEDLENELTGDGSGGSGGQRRQLSWWSVALQLIHPPCPPPGHRQPPHCRGQGSGGGSGGGGSGGSGSGSGGGG
eukprot:CAMPEP_0172550632 /NCGR_PEP_ID=MMETSP1067-20121228/30979_1 /TAXON_ID=265564 ORGANISM="Thalassiosira punctigera, Strain Tpunct2005C2" /NCGR_SAMPLE_ID=MMETSP1067 /ASSEMBLY_ACC=CAM_ASM_000444 /LENGTH=142 /DNA_ID=CAMNT_0013338257 /DNA_START=177 /DNA_END=602 /DNA_ORIENTATION=+